MGNDSSYSASVRQSLSRLDDEEIAQKLKSNSLTDEAKAIAEEVLKERGFDSSNPQVLETLDYPLENSFTDDDVIKRGFQTSNVFIWVCALFLLGISQHVNFPNGSSDSPATVVIKFFMGIGWAILGGIVVAIYSYVKRNRVVTKSEIVKRYRSNIKSIIYINLFLGLILLVKLFTGYASLVSILDIAVIFGLTFAIFKRVKSAKSFLAVYAVANPILLTFLGASGASGILWAFVFLATAQSMLIETTFESIEQAVED